MHHVFSHKFIPSLNDPATCGAGTCGYQWNHNIHNPADSQQWGGTAKPYFRLTSPLRATNDLNEAAAADDACDHPNGFDEFGRCPCGTSRPDEVTPPHVIRVQITPDPGVHGASNSHKLDADQLQAVLTEWWMGKAEEESRLVVPKAVEYGATDLRDIGRDLAECMGREVSDEEAVELGIFFYLRGKMSRWIDAVKRGDRPSDDTIFDVGVYCRMAQRNRDAGGWPGLPTN